MCDPCWIFKNYLTVKDSSRHTGPSLLSLSTAALEVFFHKRLFQSVIRITVKVAVECPAGERQAHENASVCSHPPRSPDLAPCGFWVFLKVKTTTRGKGFTSVQDIEAAMTAPLETLGKGNVQSSCRRWKSDGLRVCEGREEDRRGILTFSMDHGFCSALNCLFLPVSWFAVVSSWSPT